MTKDERRVVMQEPTITVYGAPWCPDCKRSKQFLGEHQIPYQWVDIEKDKAGDEAWQDHSEVV